MELIFFSKSDARYDIKQMERNLYIHVCDVRFPIKYTFQLFRENINACGSTRIIFYLSSSYISGGDRCSVEDALKRKITSAGKTFSFCFSFHCANEHVYIDRHTYTYIHAHVHSLTEFYCTRENRKKKARRTSEQ